MKKYYRTRYRNKFQEDNSFLSLKEVNRLLGFSGNRNKIKKGGSHQYLSWQDKEDPNKKIEAVFVYYHLVGLRSKGFDRSELHKLKTPTSYIGDLFLTNFEKIFLHFRYKAQGRINNCDDKNHIMLPSL